jgi:hypothetical protein
MNKPETLRKRRSCVPMPHDHGVPHAERGEQLSRHGEEEEPDARGDGKPE